MPVFVCEKRGRGKQVIKGSHMVSSTRCLEGRPEVWRAGQKDRLEAQMGGYGSEG